MILSIALKDFHSNLVSARFVLGFLLCLFLIPFATVVSINDYSSRVRAYEMDRKQAEENNKVRVYSALRPLIVRPPEPLRIEYADKKWAVQKRFLDRLDLQRRWAETLSLLSPSELFCLAASALCRTGCGKSPLV